MKKKTVIDINVLKSVKNYAAGQGITPSYIYKLEKEGKMILLEIDAVKFVDITKYPSIPVINRRK